mgnify:CR=1 FL=1
MYEIQWGNEGKLPVKDAKTFKALVQSATGIFALGKTDEKGTTVYRLNDENLPEDVRGDWERIADYLTKDK